MVLGIHKIDPFLSLVIPLFFNYNNWILSFNKNKVKPIARHIQLGNAYPYKRNCSLSKLWANTKLVKCTPTICLYAYCSSCVSQSVSSFKNQAADALPILIIKPMKAISFNKSHLLNNSNKPKRKCTFVKVTR